MGFSNNKKIKILTLKILILMLSLICFTIKLNSVSDSVTDTGSSRFKPVIISSSSKESSTSTQDQHSSKTSGDVSTKEIQKRPQPVTLGSTIDQSKDAEEKKQEIPSELPKPIIISTGLETGTKTPKVIPFVVPEKGKITPSEQIIIPEKEIEKVAPAKIVIPEKKLRVLRPEMIEIFEKKYEIKAPKTLIIPGRKEPVQVVEPIVIGKLAYIKNVPLPVVLGELPLVQYMPNVALINEKSDVIEIPLAISIPLPKEIKPNISPIKIVGQYGEEFQNALALLNKALRVNTIILDKYKEQEPLEEKVKSDFQKAIEIFSQFYKNNQLRIDGADNHNYVIISIKAYFEAITSNLRWIKNNISYLQHHNKSFLVEFNKLMPQLKIYCDIADKLKSSVDSNWETLYAKYFASPINSLILEICIMISEYLSQNYSLSPDNIEIINKCLTLFRQTASCKETCVKCDVKELEKEKDKIYDLKIAGFKNPFDAFKRFYETVTIIGTNFTRVALNSMSFDNNLEDEFNKNLKLLEFAYNSSFWQYSAYNNLMSLAESENEKRTYVTRANIYYQQNLALKEAYSKTQIFINNYPKKLGNIEINLRTFQKDSDYLVQLLVRGGAIWLSQRINCLSNLLIANYSKLSGEELLQKLDTSKANFLNNFDKLVIADEEDAFIINFEKNLPEETEISNFFKFLFGIYGPAFDNYGIATSFYQAVLSSFSTNFSNGGLLTGAEYKNLIQVDFLANHIFSILNLLPKDEKNSTQIINIEALFQEKDFNKISTNLNKIFSSFKNMSQLCALKGKKNSQEEADFYRQIQQCCKLIDPKLIAKAIAYYFLKKSITETDKNIALEEILAAFSYREYLNENSLKYITKKLQKFDLLNITKTSINKANEKYKQNKSIEDDQLNIWENALTKSMALYMIWNSTKSENYKQAPDIYIECIQGYINSYSTNTNISKKDSDQTNPNISQKELEKSSQDTSKKDLIQSSQKISKKDLIQAILYFRLYLAKEVSKTDKNFSIEKIQNILQTFSNDNNSLQEIVNNIMSMQPTLGETKKNLEIFNNGISALKILKQNKSNLEDFVSYNKLLEIDQKILYPEVTPKKLITREEQNEKIREEQDEKISYKIFIPADQKSFVINFEDLNLNLGNLYKKFGEWAFDEAVNQKITNVINPVETCKLEVQLHATSATSFRYAQQYYILANKLEIASEMGTTSLIEQNISNAESRISFIKKIKPDEKKMFPQIEFPVYGGYFLSNYLSILPKDLDTKNFIKGGGPENSDSLKNLAESLYFYLITTSAGKDPKTITKFINPNNLQLNLDLKTKPSDFKEYATYASDFAYNLGETKGGISTKLGFLKNPPGLIFCNLSIFPAPILTLQSFVDPIPTAWSLYRDALQIYDNLQTLIQTTKKETQETQAKQDTGGRPAPVIIQTNKQPREPIKQEGETLLSKQRKYINNKILELKQNFQQASLSQAYINYNKILYMKGNEIDKDLFNLITIDAEERLLLSKIKNDLSEAKKRKDSIKNIDSTNEVVVNLVDALRKVILYFEAPPLGAIVWAETAVSGDPNIPGSGSNEANGVVGFLYEAQGDFIKDYLFGKPDIGGKNSLYQGFFETCYKSYLKAANFYEQANMYSKQHAVIKKAADLFVEIGKKAQEILQKEFEETQNQAEIKNYLDYFGDFVKTSKYFDDAASIYNFLIDSDKVNKEIYKKEIRKIKLINLKNVLKMADAEFLLWYDAYQTRKLDQLRTSDLKEIQEYEDYKKSLVRAAIHYQTLQYMIKDLVSLGDKFLNLDNLVKLTDVANNKGNEFGQAEKRGNAYLDGIINELKKIIKDKNPDQEQEVIIKDVGEGLIAAQPSATDFQLILQKVQTKSEGFAFNLYEDKIDSLISDEGKLLTALEDTFIWSNKLFSAIITLYMNVAEKFQLQDQCDSAKKGLCENDTKCATEGALTETASGCIANKFAAFIEMFRNQSLDLRSPAEQFFET